MRKRAVHILVIVCMAMVLCGCSVITITKALEKDWYDWAAWLLSNSPTVSEGRPVSGSFWRRVTKMLWEPCKSLKR
jgi:hypothetical protein